MTGYLLTDPDCGFCQRAGAWLERHFGKHWSNVPATAEALAHHRLSIDEASAAVWFITVDRNGAVSRYRGSDAVAHAVASRGAGWRLTLLATYPPLSWLAQAVYRLIAKNRHRMPGASPTCEAP